MQARFSYEQATLVARREAEDAFVGVRTSRDQAVAQQRQVDALRRAFDLANRRYQNGVSSYLEVLDAERNLFYERAGADAGAAAGARGRRAALQGARRRLDRTRSRIAVTARTIALAFARCRRSPRIRFAGDAEVPRLTVSL